MKGNQTLGIFFIATVASNKLLPANPDHELEFELKPLESQRAFSSYFYNVLKSWYDSSVPCPMSESRVLGLDMAVPNDSGGMLFARCGTVGALLDDQDPVFSLRRLEPGRIDFAPIRGWLSYCKSHHKDFCGILQGYPRRLSCLKVIECETGAIIKLPDGCEFAALSYVWGQQGNEQSTTSRASFLPPRVPKTISDAIQATIHLNIRYLWVDQYCINQKDQTELGEQIGIMDIVYQLATVTLIAACGEDASFGLPGVSSTQRHKQPTVNINGRTWVSGQITLEERITDSKWWFRAWTYQEGFFSRRRLFFTETEIFFECNTICTQEDLAYDLHHLSDIVGNRKRSLFHGAFAFNQGSLDEHINKLSERQLTHQSDALNAMRGIFRAFSSMPSPIRHFWGIPIDRNKWLISSCWSPFWRGAISWRPDEVEFPCYFDAVLTDTLLWRLGGPSRRRDGFPSWSWTGWLGPLREFDAWMIEVRGSTMGVKVFLQKNDGTWKRISESVVAEIDAGNISDTVPYSPILRIETWVAQATFKYLPDNEFESLQDLLGTTFDKAVYHVVLPMTNPDSSPGSHPTGYWPLIPTIAVDGNDELHQELCEGTFDCLLFSPRAQHGLVVRKVGDVSERLGYLNTKPFVMKNDGPSESEPPLEYYRSAKRFTDYLPMTTKTVMLG
ncbi:HET domain-containing protein [Fusarium sp. LHS14.1]|nr:HET domain-containing protein [Fusarium sp. LHS14.1]